MKKLPHSLMCQSYRRVLAGSTKYTLFYEELFQTQLQGRGVGPKDQRTFRQRTEGRGKRSD